MHIYEELRIKRELNFFVQPTQLLMTVSKITNLLLYIPVDFCYTVDKKCLSALSAIVKLTTQGKDAAVIIAAAIHAS